MDTGGSDGGYGALAALAPIVQFLAWAGIILGSFLRGAKSRHVKFASLDFLEDEPLSQAERMVRFGAEGVGWVALGAISILNDHEANRAALNCTLWKVDCRTFEPDYGIFDFLLEVMGPFAIEAAWVMVVTAIGWSAGKFWSRHQSPTDS